MRISFIAARKNLDPEGPEGVDELNVMQWQNTKAVKRTKHALPVVR